jgi:hypothetical protein
MAPSINASPGSTDYPCEATQVYGALTDPVFTDGTGPSPNM